MRSNMGLDEVALTYSKPSVIKETRAHFDSLLRKAANQEGDLNPKVVNDEYTKTVLSPIHGKNEEKILQYQSKKRKKDKHRRRSRQKLLDPGEELLFTDDEFTSTDDVQEQGKVSEDVIVHCNPAYTESDSDSKNSPNNLRAQEQAESLINSKNKKHFEAKFSSSNDSSPSSVSLKKKDVDLAQSSDEEGEDIEKEWCSVPNTTEKSYINNTKGRVATSQPTPPPRTKKMPRKLSLTKKLSKLSSHFSESTLSSQMSSADSIKTAVRLSPTENQRDTPDFPQDNESSVGLGPDMHADSSRGEKIKLKPLTGWTPSYEEIDETTLSSRTADLPPTRSRSEKNIQRRRPTENSVQSYEEIEVDSKEEAHQSTSKKSRSRQTQSLAHRTISQENVSTAKLRQRNLSKAENSETDEDIGNDEASNANYDYDQVLGILIHHCDRLQVDSLIIHPVVRVHVIDVSTGKYLKKSNEARCYSYEEPSNIDYIQPISTQPCNFPALRSLTPTWEEMLIINEDIKYLTAEGMNVIILFEINDFVSFEMASLQYKKLGSEGGWHRIAWAFLKPIASNGSSNLNKRLRLQLFKPAAEKRGKASLEKCHIYQHWLKGSRSRYPATLHVTVQGVSPTSDFPSPHSTLHPDVGNIDVLPPSIALPVDQVHDQDDIADQKSSNDDEDQANEKPAETISWSRIPGQTCKIPNEASLILSAGTLGCFVLKFSPCGKYLALNGANHNSHSLLVYGIPSGTLLKRFNGHQGLIYDLQWSTGSKFVLSSSADCTACIWDVGTALVKMIPHPSFVYCASFFPGDDQALHLVTGCCDHIVRVWTRSGKHEDFRLAQELRGHEGFITSISIDETGKVYSGDSEGKIRIWSSEGSLLSLVREVNVRELNGVAISRLVPHPGGQRLLIHARDSTLRMVNIATGSPIQWFTGALNHRLQTGATLSPCGRLVLSASEDGSFWIWNADTGKQLAVYSHIIQGPTTQKSVLPLSGTVDYHPFEHMAAFSVYGKHSPVVICVYSKNPSGKSLGLQLLTGNANGSSVPSASETVRNWMKMKDKKSEADDSNKDSFRLGRESISNSSRPEKSSHSYEGSLASIIQQMDEVIALTRRSNHPCVSIPATSNTKLSPVQREKENREHFPQLTRVSEKEPSQSSSSSTSVRRNPRQVMTEHKTKRRHSSSAHRRKSDGNQIKENTQASSEVLSSNISTVATIRNTVNDGQEEKKAHPIAISETKPQEITNFHHNVISVSSLNSDGDSHVVDLTEVLS